MKASEAFAAWIDGEHVLLVTRAIHRTRDEPVLDRREPHLKALREQLAILNDLLLPVLSDHGCTECITVMRGRGTTACA